MYYHALRHLPHIISYACSGSNLVNCCLEYVLDRPRAFFPYEGPYDQKLRVTTLNRDRQDFLWVQLPDMTPLITVDRGPALYIYRDPVHTLYTWFTFMRIPWSNPDSVVAPAKMLTRHLRRHLREGGSESFLRMEDWIDNPIAQLHRVADHVAPGFQLQSREMPPITIEKMERASRTNDASFHDYFGSYGPDMQTKEGQRFEDMHGNRIRDIVFRENLQEFFK